ncbi:flagellar filament capping protein FliD, partial [Planctomycetota bacterium]
LYESASVSSSNENVLVATANKGFSLTGSYQFTVKQLASADQFVSGGFNSPDYSFSAGQVTIEVGQGAVRKQTDLSLLNGGHGVSRGIIQITDKSGASANVDLNGAITIDDITTEINSITGIHVTAALNASGDGIEITDTSGGGGNFIISDINGSSTAAELQIAGSTAGNSLGAASNLMFLDGETLLSQLNDGRGVRIGVGSDFNVLMSDGLTNVAVNLDGAETVQDVLDAVNAAHANLEATITADGKGITITDTLGGGNQLTITDSSSQAASDLGITNTTAKAVALDSLGGRDILAGLNTVLLTSLNGGSGVAQGQVDITDRLGNTATIDLSSAQTLQDVIEAINSNGVAQVQAEVNSGGSGLRITDLSGGTGALQINENGSTTAADLGIENGAGVNSNQYEGQNLQFQYISENTLTDHLNGGNGVAKGKIRIIDKQGTQYEVSLAEANNNTIGSIIQDINGATGGAVVASINANGDGIVLTDTTGGGLELRVEEIDGSTARDLNILRSSEAGVIDGSFEYLLDIEDGDSLEDISRKINDSGIAVTASVLNDGAPFNPYRLNLISNLTGADGQLVMDFSQMGIDFTQSAKGRDAVVLYGSSTPGNSPLLIRSSDNIIENALPQLDLELKSASEVPVTISADRDIGGITNQVQGLVDSVNSVLDSIKEFTKFNAESLESGLLLGDTTMRNIETTVHRMFSSRITGLDTSLNTLAQLGIRVTEGGKFSFDTTKFQTKLETDLESVKEFFTRKDTVEEDGEDVTKAIGFAVKLEEYMDMLTDSMDGVIQTRTEGYDLQIDDLNDRIDDQTDRIASLEERLILQFANLEIFMSQAQATMQRLTSSLIPMQPFSKK